MNQVSTSTRRPNTKQSTQSKHLRRTGLSFVAPFYIVFLAMLVIPLVYAAYLSLFKTRLVGGISFVGFENYLTALQDPRLHDGLLRVLKFFVIQVPLMLILALAIALAIDSGMMRLSKIVRLGVFLPYAVPSVIAALMWGYIYGAQYGPFADLFGFFGMSSPEFLSSGNILGSIANIVTWEFTGYNMIIIYAALRSISTELYEAAAVDGAGAWRIAWSIKIPAVLPAIFLCIIFSIIGAFQLFNEPNLLQKLAPAVIDSSFTPNLYAYSLAFTGQQVNYAAAVSFLLGGAIFLVSYVAQRFARKRATK